MKLLILIILFLGMLELGVQMHITNCHLGAYGPEYTAENCTDGPVALGWLWEHFKQ